MTDDKTRPIETAPDIAQPPGNAPAPDLAPPQPPPVAAAAPAGAPPAGAPPVQPATTGGSRTRWAIGLGIAGIAAAIGIGAFLLLGSRPVPEALKYIPGDAAVVAELRMDLPGDQLQKLGNLLAHFPGFLDQTTLPAKLDEGLGQLLGGMSNGEVDYIADIKPWLNGPAFVGFRPETGQGTEGAAERGVLSATTNGATTCEQAFEGRPMTHEPYRGLQLAIVANEDLACVIDGRQALLGDTQSVHAALDAKGNGTGIDRSERYRNARNALQGDQLATVYVDGTVIGGMLPDGGELPIPSGLGGFAPNIPDWAITGVRAEDDALVVDSVAAQPPASTGGPSLLPLPAAHDSVIAGLLPANTIFYIDNQATGVTLQNLLTQLRSVPELDAPLGMLDGMGGAGELVGWIDDAGIVVTKGAPVPNVGVLLVARDEDAAASRIASIRGLLAFAGLGGEGIQVTESTVAGVPVTTVVISDLGSLIPPGTLPGEVPTPTDASVSFSFAAKGRVIYLGIGAEALTALLSVQPGGSLADQAVYQQATARSIDGSRMGAYVDVREVVEIVRGLMDQEFPTTLDVAYLAPIKAITFSTSSDASSARSRLVVSVSNP